MAGTRNVSTAFKKIQLLVAINPSMHAIYRFLLMASAGLQAIGRAGIARAALRKLG
jgi:hypothetical protein